MLFLRCDVAVLDFAGCCLSALAAVPLSATESLLCLLGEEELSEARRAVLVAELAVAPAPPAPAPPPSPTPSAPETVARLPGGLRLRLVARPAAPLVVLVRVPVRVLVPVRLVRSTPALLLERTLEDVAVGRGGLPGGEEEQWGGGAR